MNSVRERWERRAVASGRSLAGVLFRGLSDGANAAMNSWHSWVVARIFGPLLTVDGTVLDLGCGFGRLATVLRAARPDLYVIGQDIAMDYCRAFHEDIGPSIVADIEALPFRLEALHGVAMVTSLMYADRAAAAGVLGRIEQVLKPGGLLLLLDPGRELQDAIGAVRPRSADSPTAGRGFGCDEYASMIVNAGFVVVSRGGNPRLSTALLVPGVGASSRPMVWRMLACIARLDRRAGGYSRLALHRWVLARKPAVTS